MQSAKSHKCWVPVSMFRVIRYVGHTTGNMQFATSRDTQLEWVMRWHKTKDRHPRVYARNWETELFGICPRLPWWSLRLEWYLGDRPFWAQMHGCNHNLQLSSERNNNNRCVSRLELLHVHITNPGWVVSCMSCFIGDIWNLSTVE